VVKAIKVTGSESVLVHANVVSGTDIKKIIAAATALSLDGKIDILVHNVGRGDNCFLEDITEEFYTT
jgi:3-oxoacyl-[acyl-carrier protein] reductase